MRDDEKKLAAIQTHLANHKTIDGDKKLAAT